MLFWCDQKHDNWLEHLVSPDITSLNIFSPNYKEISRTDPHNSKHLVDIYFFTHVIWSMILCFLLSFRFSRLQTTIAVIAVSIIFEIYENLPSSLEKYQRIEKDSDNKISYRGDSLINIVGDIAGNIIGIWTYWNYTHMFIPIFLLIVSTVGWVYWTDFFSFILTALIPK